MMHAEGSAIVECCATLRSADCVKSRNDPKSKAYSEAVHSDQGDLIPKQVCHALRCGEWRGRIKLRSTEYQRCSNEDSL